MKNKTIKTIGLCLTLFFSALFINAADVKAEIAVDQGTAECRYMFDYNATKIVQMTIIVQKRTLETKCQFSPNLETGIGWSSNYGCSVKKSPNLSDAIHHDGTNNYQCPTLYIKKNGQYVLANEGNTTYTYDYELTTDASEASAGKIDNSGGPLHLFDQVIYRGNDIQDKDDQFTNNNDSAKDVLDRAHSAWTDKGTVEDINKWGKYGDGNSDASYENKCNLISQELWDDIKVILTVVNVAGILLLIVLSAIEFIKAITGSEEDKIKKAFKNTLFRAVACVILLILPMVVTMMIELVNGNNVKVDENGAPVIGEDNEPLCNVK